MWARAVGEKIQLYNNSHYWTNKARVKRRISHVPNLNQDSNVCEVRSTFNSKVNKREQERPRKGQELVRVSRTERGKFRAPLPMRLQVGLELGVKGTDAGSSNPLPPPPPPPPPSSLPCILTCSYDKYNRKVFLKIIVLNKKKEK